MAEFAEIEEIIDFAEEGFDEAADGEAEVMTKEEFAELEESIAETEKSVTELSEDVKEFKKLSKFSEALKKFTTFVAQNIAIGVILFGVNIVLEKLIAKAKGGEKEKLQKERKIIKSLADLIKTETKISKDVSGWLKKHQDDVITLAGIEIPLEAIFHKYLQPISDAVTAAINAAKPLQHKDDGGKATWSVPTAGQVTDLLSAAGSFLDAFDKFKEFCISEEAAYPVLRTLPLEQNQLAVLRIQLNDLRKTPF